MYLISARQSLTIVPINVTGKLWDTTNIFIIRMSNSKSLDPIPQSTAPNMNPGRSFQQSSLLGTIQQNQNQYQFPNHHVHLSRSDHHNPALHPDQNQYQYLHNRGLLVQNECHNIALAVTMLRLYNLNQQSGVSNFHTGMDGLQDRNHTVPFHLRHYQILRRDNDRRPDNTVGLQNEDIVNIITLIYLLFPAHFIIFYKRQFMITSLACGMLRGNCLEGSYKPSVLAMIELPLVARPQSVTLIFFAYVAMFRLSSQVNGRAVQWEKALP